MLTLGLDFHGVIDTYPKKFGELSRVLMMTGNSVYIITGAKNTPELRVSLDEFGVVYTDILSIVDFHLNKGTTITYDSEGNPWLDESVWDRTKADLCKQYKVDLLIDNSTVYGKYFTENTKYLLFQ